MTVSHLFPDDARQGDDWVHVVGRGELHLYDAGLWQVAEWFTGRGAAYEALMESNGLGSPELRQGQRIVVPAALLHPALRAGLRSDDGLLEFRTDDAGPFAAYRLRAGEAVYSSVIVRFTGRTDADDVSRIAEALRARSGIPDLRDIPVGFEVRIPLDLLEPEFLPAGHPRREEAEARERELARALAQQPLAGPRSGLEGVLIVIDPGHGGRDLGTMNNGIWEHDYVYDVACRLREKLVRLTAATVVMTLEDRETGCEPSKQDKLKANRQGTVLTNPPFLAKKEGEAKYGVNLRWYLANSVYRKAVATGHDPDRIVFISLHADSRHPSLSGVMVYVPGAAYRTRTYGHNSGIYLRYDEVKEKPQVRFTKQERVRSEAISRKYADAIVRSFREEGLPVQPHQPVRHRIIRGNSRFVPAVLRGNEIPNKVLVEMVNLGNPGDAALLASAVNRDRLAGGLFRSLLDYYGEDRTRVAGASAAAP
jgi:N-acetylmuramoyl-L-alanine amidase